MSAQSRRLLVLCSIVVITASCSSSGETDAQPTRAGQVIERFSLKKDSCWILLPVEIKGKRYHFGLDTGMECTTYDKSLWHLMGRTMALQKIGRTDESSTVPLFQPPDAWIGNLALPKDSLVMGTDLKEFYEETGEDVPGIIGMDFLKRYIFRIDFDRGEVVFLHAVGPDPGQRLDVRLIGGRPHAQVKLPGINEREWFLLDTGKRRKKGGAFGGSFRKAIFDVLIESGNLTSIVEQSELRIAGRRICRCGWLDSLPFASNTHNVLLFSEDETSHLSLDLLSRYLVTFDFPHQAIYLKKSRQFDRPTRYDRSGLYVRHVKGQTGVAEVSDGSAAAKAGILPGDVLLQIDKEQINGMTLFTLRDRLCEAGKKVVLTVRRGAQQMDAPLVLSSDK